MQTSRNYEIAIGDGYVEGGATYTSEIPHHGPGYCYTSMHIAARESEFIHVIEGGAGPCRILGVNIQEEFPKISDDAESDWIAADSTGNVKTYLVREVSGTLEFVKLSLDGYFIEASGFDHVDDIGEFWSVYYYEVEISREA